jgi:hypothetical protein
VYIYTFSDMNIFLFVLEEFSDDVNCSAHADEAIENRQMLLARGMTIINDETYWKL